MLDRNEIGELLEMLNERLSYRREHASLILAGGAVMSFVFGARAATLDIDALMEPSSIIRSIAAEMAEDLDLENDWINDGVKGFVDTAKMGTVPVKEYSNLIVRRLDDESLLALKLSSARDNDGKDLADAAFLLDRLGIVDVDSALDIVEKYIPVYLLTPKVQFFTRAALEEAALINAPRVREDADTFNPNDLLDEFTAASTSYGQADISRTLYRKGSSPSRGSRRR